MSVIDFQAALRRKRVSECPHDHADVDMDVASISCRDCGHELDPWWFLRKMVVRDEEIEAGHEERRRKWEQQMDLHAKWIEGANATVKRMTDEIQKLYDTKNKLWNEQVNGVPLGALAAGRRRRARAPG